MTAPHRTRRTILAGVAATAVPVAGCLESADDESDLDEEDDDPAEDEPTEEGADDGDESVPGEDEADEPADSDEDESEGDQEDPEEVEIAVSEVATGLSHPWAIAVLPEGDLLVTEREGRLNHVDPESGDIGPVEGVPEVHAEGQGGLLNVELHPDFAEEPWVYLTYAAETGGEESATHLGRGRFDAEAMAIEGFEELYAADAADSNGHYGSRVVFDDDGMLYLTLGDRQFKDFDEDHVSQDRETDLGTTLRLESDGSVPEDNPFVGEEDAIDAIYSYGHRNVQGMTVHPETGELWQAEHGEEDGDEINVVEAGGNYGWPLAHYGCEYGTDDPVGVEPPDLEETIDPVYYWECGSGGFPPSGATVYDGEAFPAWEGDLFVGNLAGQYLGRFTVDGAGTDDVAVEEMDPLLEDREWRVRDVVVHPDSGHLYVAVDGEDAPIVLIEPE